MSVDPLAVASRDHACPRVKICGVTLPEDALVAAELGADFLGLNFHPPSPRCVARTAALEIAAAVAGRVPLVGVFVNRPAGEIEETAALLGLDLVQLSGDEGPAEVARFAGRVIKVFRTGGDPGEAALAPYAEAWALLFDARHGALYGGTGRAWPYGAVAGLGAAGWRVFVAGGLKAGNARQAIAASGAYGIDVCSGVESVPGVKDHGLLRQLFEEVRHGAQDLAP